MLLRDNVYGALRADILTCRLAPGEEIREQELAARYEVSSAPVRDALRRLESDRLVTVQPRQGYRVNSISMADARDIFQFRVVLESACAALAAENATAETLAALEKFREFEPHGDFVEYNRGFHAAIAKASGNLRMEAMGSDLIDQSERLVRISVASIKTRDPAKLVTEHGAILDAIAARDGRAAARLIRAHVSKAEHRVLTALARSAVTL
jgi:DNA-binding GntR family transcriptional regulator